MDRKGRLKERFVYFIRYTGVIDSNEENFFNARWW